MNAARLRKNSEHHQRRRAEAQWDAYRDHVLGPGWRTGWPEGSTWVGERDFTFAGP